MYAIFNIHSDDGYTGNYGFGLFNRNTGALVYPNIVREIISVAE